MLVNRLIWDKHANGLGLLALAVCLAAGSFYTPAPVRSSTAPPAAGKQLQAGADAAAAAPAAHKV